MTEVATQARPPRSRFAEMLTVAGAEVVEMVMSVRFLFLLAAYGGAGGLAGYVWTSLDENSNGQLTEFSEKAANISEEERAQALEQMMEQGGPMIEMMGSIVLDPVLPPLAMLVLQGTSWLLPLLILLVGYNRIAEDLESRYTRYVLQRVHRESYLAGKIVGHALVCFVAVLLVQVLWIVFAQIFEVYGADGLWGAAPRIWLGMFVYVLAYSAFTMFASTLFARSVMALLLGAMLMYAIWFAANVASVIWAPLGWMWLSSWYPALWRLDPIGYAVFAAYILVFVGLASAILRRVDL